MSEAKVIRGQVRQVMQEVLPEILSSEAGLALKKEIDDNIARRIDSVNAYCTGQLAAMDKRAKAVQGFLMQEVKGGIHHSMADMDVTIQAIVETLAASGVVVEDFVGKVNAAKPEIIAKRRADAEAKMKADLEAQQAAEAAENAAAEVNTNAPEAPAATQSE